MTVNKKSTEFVGMTPWCRVEEYLGFSKWELGCVLEIHVAGPSQKLLYVYHVTECHIPGGGVLHPLEES
jgi:hypothetical protein